MNKELVKFLSDRKDVAYSALLLCRYIGGNSRSLRQDVNELRKAGVPIISGDFGYMYTHNIEHINKCISRLTATALNTLEISNCLETIKNKIQNKDSYGPLFDEHD